MDKNCRLSIPLCPYCSLEQMKLNYTDGIRYACEDFYYHLPLEDIKTLMGDLDEWNKSISNTCTQVVR